MLISSCCNLNCRIQNPNIPRAGLVGAPGGPAGRGRAALGANKIMSRKQSSLVPSEASKKRRFNVSPEERTNVIICKPKVHQSQLLTRRLSAVYPRLSESWDLSSPKPGHTTEGRVGARNGVAGRSRAGLFANRTVRLGNNPSPHSPKHRRHVA